MACRCFDSNKEEKYFTSYLEYFEACKCTCNARLKVEENKMTFEIVGIAREELDKIDKIKVDNYLISSAQVNKCDYLFMYKPDENTKDYIFTELKGSDVTKAVTQIESTIEILKQESVLNNQNHLTACIVSSRVPANDGSYRRAKSKIEDKYKRHYLRLITKNHQLKYNPIKRTHN